MITKEQKKIDMMNDFLNVLELEIEEADKAHVPFGDWPVTEKILLDGRQFSFKKHEYLIEPYHDTHPYQVEIKATQLGLTSKALLRVIYGCRYETYRGILYLFPSRTDVTDLSKTRLTPLIEENPDTIGRWIRDTDSANVKKIWNSFLYLRGMKSRIGIKSIPVDFEVFDELDEAPQNAVDMALERMAHSDTGDLLFLSNPTLPDFGIDKLFCVSPDTKILTSDLVHVNASSLKIGDELIGFDENKLPENKTRCYRRTKVVALKKVFLPSVRITLENGTSVVCSKQHRWLNSIGGNTRFKIAKHFKVGDNMIYIGTWDVDNTRDGGWLSGIFDGEGSVGCSKKDERRGTATYVSFTQNEGFVLRNTTKLLDKFGFSYHIHEAHKEGYGSCYNIKLKGGLPERLRFIGTFRPCRLLPKSSILWEGRSVGNDAGATKRILIEKIEDIGTVELIAIETEHKTYIANGLLSHNSDTDQQFFLLKCSKCNEYTDLVETFPNCLQRVRGRVIRACQKCGAELDPSVGKWVAKRPSITERRGRQYSQLYSQTKTTTPELILHKFETTDNMTDFYNLKIGLAYVDAANRLSVQEVLACCGDNGMMTESSQGCFMGVDQGANLHVVIGRHHKSRAGEIIWAGILKGNNENDKTDESGWLELDALMNRFKVMRCVVDAMPNTKLARNFSDRFRGRVFLCYYNEHQKGSYRWNEKDMIVQANRTESLDASHREITTNNIVIPRRSDLIQKFAEQMHNVAKRLEVDDETGSQKYVYHRLGADHFRHAFNYESMARRSSPELLFPEML